MGPWAGEDRSPEVFIGRGPAAGTHPGAGPGEAGRLRVATKFYLGDVVQMRKPHPCGSDQWEVLRTGMDFRIRCLGCGRVVMLPRRRFERQVKAIVRRVIEEEPLP